MARRVVGVHVHGAARLPPDERLQVVHPGVVRAQLPAADQDQARAVGAAGLQSRAQPLDVGHDRLGRQLHAPAGRTQDVGDARLQRPQVDPVRRRLQASQREPVGIHAEAVAVGTAAQHQVEQPLGTAAGRQRRHQLGRVAGHQVVEGVHVGVRALAQGAPG